MIDPVNIHVAPSWPRQARIDRRPARRQFAIKHVELREVRGRGFRVQGSDLTVMCCYLLVTQRALAPTFTYLVLSTQYSSPRLGPAPIVSFLNAEARSMSPKAGGQKTTRM